VPKEVQLVACNNKADAEALWQKLRSAFRAAEKAVRNG